MIVDNLKNCALYYGAHKNFKKAFAFLEEAVRENYGDGSYEIDGKEVYASISDGETVPQKDQTFEGHRKYIDIQFIVSGEELFKAADVDKLPVTKEYDPEGDYALFEGNDKVHSLILGANEYAIFFPHDLHKPGLAVGNVAGRAKKIIVKVMV